MSDVQADTSAEIFAIVVTYNSRLHIEACLEGLYSSRSKLRIVIVDNASSDETANFIESQYPDVNLLRNTSNVGFAVAVNQALQRRNESEHVLLLNPDATMDPQSLDELVSAMTADPNVGIVGPRIVHPAGRLKVLSAGNQPTAWRIFTQFSGLSRLSKKSSWLEGMNLLHGVHDTGTRRVEWVSGACMLIRSNAVTELRSFSERWFMYAEDLELCARAYSAGWQILHVPSAVVTHQLGASASTSGPTSTMWIESTADYVHRDLETGKLRLLLWHVFLSFGMASRAAYYALRSLPDSPSRALWRAESRRFSAYAAASMKIRYNHVQ
jgi:N-acetylglucosaminyl-diphospho-decaprenol L-rhamnosyltransferase